LDPIERYFSTDPCTQKFSKVSALAQLIKTKNKKEQSIIPRAAAAYRNSGKSVP
jgi:hypothetical protein